MQQCSGCSPLDLSHNSLQALSAVSELLCLWVLRFDHNEVVHPHRGSGQ